MKHLRYSVFLRFLCIIIMLCKSIPVSADNSFPACLVTNPCDCGCSKIKEMWPSTIKTFKGKTYTPVENSYDGNCCCPPYNKTAGRSGCLLNKSPAGIFNMAYFNACAEESPESDYFSPKIRYRGQACNIACWTYKGDLFGSGECAILATPYGLPTVRLCARVAVPADPVNHIGQDEGYTPDMHLDFEGYFIDDNPISNGGYDQNGQPLSVPNPLLQSPKVCLYFDPSLIDTLLNIVAVDQIGILVIPVLIALSQTMGGVAGASPGDALLSMINPDLVDINPISQPLQHSSGVSPLFSFMITLLEAGANIATALAGFMKGLPDFLNPVASILEGLLRLVDIVINSIGVPFLKFIGTLNRVVVGSFGCVNVPLGPYPPPYCTPLQTNFSIPMVYSICETTVLNDGSTVLSQVSSNYDPCQQKGASCTHPIPYGLCANPAITGERNNFIHNSIRVGFNDYKPLCQSNSIGDNTDLTISGQCVNIIGTNSAAIMHSATSAKDTIPLCSSSNAIGQNDTCVSSTYLSQQCQSTNPAPWYCTNGFRVAYSVGSASPPEDYYDVALPDCGGLSIQCQSIWGVNLGAYADLVVTFPNTESTNNTSVQQSSKVSLLDSTGSSHNFYAAIPRVTTQIATGATVAQEPDQICVYETNSTGNIVAVGCNARPIPPKPTVYSCDGSLCTSTFFNPKMITSLSIPAGSGFDSTQGVVGPTTDDPSVPSTINLAGFNYAAYGTDQTFAKQPFSGGNAIINSSSIYGNYLNNIPPYNVIGQSNTSAVYLGGIEYLNGQYQEGATLLCLSGYQVDDCLTGQTRQNCVLANLLNNQVMSCTAFQGIITKYSNIDVCNPNNTLMACDYNHPIETYNGNNNNIIKILSCEGMDNNGNANGITSVCYDYGAQNGRLCQVSEDAANRIIPTPSYGSTLPYSTTANVNYYNYSPGISSSPNAQASLTSQTNATLVNTVVQAAQTVFQTSSTATFAASVCQSNPTNLTQNPTSDFAQGAMSACNTARGANAELNSICSASQALVTNHTSALYQQLVNACNTAQTNMQPILTDQFNTQLLQQMQTDAINAKNIVSNLMRLINNFTSNPSLISNITTASQTVFNSTDTVQYPTTASKINAICSQTTALVMTTDPQTQAPIADPSISPLIYNALTAACTTAQNAGAAASIDVLTTLNTTLQGFTQYSLNPAPTNASGALTSTDGSSTVGYIEPNLNTMIVRNRTDLENGLCVAVPQPQCAAVTSGGANDGFANWTNAAIGKQSVGTCIAGYTPISTNPSSLLRYCTVDKVSKVASFVPVGTSIGCTADIPIFTSLKIVTNAGTVTNIYNIPIQNLTLQSYNQLPPFANEIDASTFITNANATNNLDQAGNIKYKIYYVDDVSKYAANSFGKITSAMKNKAMVIRITSKTGSTKLTANYSFLSTSPLYTTGVAHGYTILTKPRISVPYFVMGLNPTTALVGASSNTCSNVSSQTSWTKPCATDYWVQGSQVTPQNTGTASMYTGRNDLCFSTSQTALSACKATKDPTIAFDIWIIFKN